MTRSPIELFWTAKNVWFEIGNGSIGLELKLYPIFACKQVADVRVHWQRKRGVGGHKLLGAVFFTPVLSL